MSIHLAPERSRLSTIVTAVFADRASAERGWEAVIARGYKPSDISAIVSQDTHNTLLGVKTPPNTEKALEGAGVGGAIGMSAGALTAVLVAVGSALLLPGVGLVLAGPIVAGLAGAGAGGAVGAILGSIVGADVPADRVKGVADHVKRGGFVLTVHARSIPDANAIELDWKKAAVEVIR
jgi:hypothetical protein